VSVPPEIHLTASWVVAALEAVHGKLIAGDRERVFGGVSIDTRSIARDDLFIGIRGERWDGTDFANLAIDAGAAGVLLPAGRGSALVGASPAAIIEVDDPTRALQMLARAVRRESGTKVVAITGSAGKTTTKEITSEFLATTYRVVRNRGNLNNHIGLPLSLMELRKRPDIAVVELGMNHTGEIKTLVGIAEPEVRVWTNVGDAHLAFFDSVDAIADAKAEIFEGAGASDVLVASADDERIRARLPRFPGRVVTFGFDRDADVRVAHVIDRGIDGVAARLTTSEGPMQLETRLIGRANLANVAAAAAVAIELGVPVAKLAERAATLVPARHRGEVVRLGSGVTVIDDSYNANPSATRLALDVLANTSATRRIAVLGEMLELGERSAELHRAIGRAVSGGRVDLLIAVGGEPAAELAEIAARTGMPRARVRYFTTSDEAAAVVSTLIEPGDVVLVKGSRGVGTDRIVERIVAQWAPPAHRSE
jgi:UDP-N-acetylmuramoyl-tripeptide--D-alanyl-D-alanine ligase